MAVVWSTRAAWARMSRASAALLSRVTLKGQVDSRPVVVVVRPELDLGRIVALELAGFRVITKPVAVADLFAKVAVDAEPRRR